MLTSITSILWDVDISDFSILSELSSQRFRVSPVRKVVDFERNHSRYIWWRAAHSIDS